MKPFNELIRPASNRCEQVDCMPCSVYAAIFFASRTSIRNFITFLRIYCLAWRRNGKLDEKKVEYSHVYITAVRLRASVWHVHSRQVCVQIELHKVSTQVVDSEHMSCRKIYNNSCKHISEFVVVVAALRQLIFHEHFTFCTCILYLF